MMYHKSYPWIGMTLVVLAGVSPSVCVAGGKQNNKQVYTSQSPQRTRPVHIARESLRGVHGDSFSQNTHAHQGADEASPNRLLYKCLFVGALLIGTGLAYYQWVWRPGYSQAFWGEVVRVVLEVVIANMILAALKSMTNAL